jgi:hypothetical protein
MPPSRADTAPCFREKTACFGGSPLGLQPHEPLQAAVSECARQQNPIYVLFCSCPSSAEGLKTAGLLKTNSTIVTGKAKIPIVEDQTPVFIEQLQKEWNGFSDQNDSASTGRWRTGTQIKAIGIPPQDR